MSSRTDDGTTRCFVGVWPPLALEQALRRVVLPVENGVRLVDPTDHHITLRFLGEVHLSTARAALDGFRFESVEAVCGPRLQRLGPRHLVVPVVGLDDLADRVAALTTPFEQHPTNLPFRGHVSIATSRDPDLLDAAAGVAFSCDFTVEQIALIASTADGYRTVSRYAAAT